MTDSRIAGARGTVNSIDFDEMKEISQISSVERIFSAIPSSVIAQRATDCHSYPRALFHWEAYLREERTRGHDDCDDLDYVYLRMQRIYAEIDEPDGIEGISSHLHILDPEQQVLELKKNGKWEAAQSWYELEMLENEDQAGSQLGLLTCLRESGQQGELTVPVRTSAYADRAQTQFSDLSRIEIFQENGLCQKLMPTLQRHVG